MTTTATLEEIDRIHDSAPQQAAEGLRALDASALPADRLPLLAFLLLHVLGEKLGLWDEAARRLGDLGAKRADAPEAVVAHAAVAAEMAGHADSPALARLEVFGGRERARTVVELNAISLRAGANAPALAAALERLAEKSHGFDPNGPLNRRLAIGFNNATSQLLDLAAPPVDAAVRAALLAGSAAAQRFWQAAGNWVNFERALYLRALVHNRVGDAAAARDACVQALDVIAANGAEDVDRTFLKLQLAGALQALGESADGQRHHDEARQAAAQWDDAGLKSWFADEHRRLFGPEERES